MSKRETLHLRQVTEHVAAVVADVAEAIALAKERERQSAAEALGRAAASELAAARAEMEAASAARRDDIADAVRQITGGIEGWTGTYRRSAAIDDQVRCQALEWTRWTSPDARTPSGAMVAAREAELVVREWLERRLGGPVRDVSREKDFPDGGEPAYLHYDLLHEGYDRRYDVKNTIAPRLARHVLGRERPSRGVTLIGAAHSRLSYGPMYEMLGALDAADLAAWERFMKAVDGVDVLVTPTVARSGGRVRPSWIFGSPRHLATSLPCPPGPQDPIGRLDRLDAWSEVPAGMRLLDPSGRAALPAGGSDADRLLWRFALRLQELGVARLELRHLYVLTLDDFRQRYRDRDYDASIYERALLPDGIGGGVARWRTPGGTWDPCQYYRTLVSGLGRLALCHAALPPVIRTIHVTPAGTVIANYRHPSDRGGPPSITLLAICGTRDCARRHEPGGDPWLVYGEEGVEVVEPRGFLRCPGCGATAG